MSSDWRRSLKAQLHVKATQMQDTDNANIATPAVALRLIVASGCGILKRQALRTGRAGQEKNCLRNQSQLPYQEIFLIFC